MKHAVITGGTRGIGKGLAREFARSDFRVSFTGRDKVIVHEVEKELISETGNSNINGYPCEITDVNQLEETWKSLTRIAPVDIWINNAGTGHDQEPFAEMDTNEIVRVLRTNIEGMMLATRVILEGMKAQGFGAIYNMEGFGSDGRIMYGMSVYGTSKNALRYFNRSIILENKKGPVLIGSISPGMVVTDLLVRPNEDGSGPGNEALKIFNILADEVETVTPWLVKQIIRNKKHGARIAWLTGTKVALRFILNPVRKRKLKSLSKFS